MHDIVIKNGTIYDGSGEEPYKGDVAVKNGKISKIAPHISDAATEVIDASGLAVSPGFIDMHSHSDDNFTQYDSCESKIYQGVTTELAGQCGYTLFPCPEGKRDIMKKFALGGATEYISESLGAFMARVKKENKKMAVNLGYLIGHGALRAVTVGFEGRTATDAEIQEMQRLLDIEMQSGAWGLSLGLGYAPGVFCDQKELNALGEVVAKYDGIVASHMRNQADDIFSSLEEMFEINRATGARVNISHLKYGGKNNYGHADRLWDYIEKAKQSGVDVTADMYPYEASSTGLTNILPKWSLDGGISAAAARFETSDSAKLMDSLREQLKTQKDGENIFVVATYGKAQYADGKNIYEISEELGLPMAETAAKIIVETGGICQCVFFSMDPEDVKYLLKQQVAIGSDGSAYPLDPDKNPGRHHPRNFGTFPCFLRMAREHNLCSLPMAIHRITKMSADIMKNSKIGLLKEGLNADITVFDPNTIRDNASYKNPFQKATGLAYVIVNGVVAIKNNEQTAARAGEFMLRGR